MTTPEFLSATEQAALVRAKELSPVELLEIYLARIEKLDPELNAFVTVIADEALADAARKEQEVSAGGELPPFHGVPIPIKELDDVEGVRTTYSSRSYEDHVPVADAATVTSLRAAGFVIVGKSNAPEFGTIPMTESDLNGVCRNPWDVTRTPGGSSGGAGAARVGDGSGRSRIGWRRVHPDPRIVRHNSRPPIRGSISVRRSPEPGMIRCSARWFR